MWTTFTTFQHDTFTDLWVLGLLQPWSNVEFKVQMRSRSSNVSTWHKVKQPLLPFIVVWSSSKYPAWSKERAAELLLIWWTLGELWPFPPTGPSVCDLHSCRKNTSRLAGASAEWSRRRWCTDTGVIFLLSSQGMPSSPHTHHQHTLAP